MKIIKYDICFICNIGNTKVDGGWNVVNFNELNSIPKNLIINAIDNYL